MKRLLPELPYFIAPLTLVVIAHWCVDADSEPYFNNDETRHVMTGVFFRDAIADKSTGDPKTYAINYYMKYPALGLMVWPPLYYAIEGVWMTCFGTSFDSAKALIAVFGVIAAIYFYRLVRRSHDSLTAAFALGILGFSPMIFEFSRQVMLELPCLALVLGSVFHFERFLDEQRRRDAWFACLLAGLAALTRFDGVFLLLYFAVRLLTTRNLTLLKRRCVIGGVVLALLLTAPYYLYTFKVYGGTIAKTAQEESGFFALKNFVYYLGKIPEQIGWWATIAAIIGFICSLRPKERQAAGPAFGLMFVTYAFFSPIAEVEVRHTIYWLPALAIFAARGCMTVAKLVNEPRFAIPLTAVILAGTAITSIRAPSLYVRGYDEAARYVVENNRETRTCLMDGFLNGGFIYHVRRHDPERRLWVLRGDKVFYTVLCDPNAGYKEHAKGEADVLALIHRYDPELIVVEEPQLYFDLDGARLLRKVLHEHPERFRLEKTIPIRSNHFRFVGHNLEIWRSLIRNPDRAANVEFEMLTIGRSLGAEIGK